ncbi:hypothetical protein E6O75_ATG09938 [Venturia nashicola]|uniref:Uncharacterized protein n=1 Tax=Venturia nashicola TaxID=86259 RepID=A0A4Z1NZX6_9PEZI|nr:hypothetical protein E6O75_ATG09938 [Venturia nashicola]
MKNCSQPNPKDEVLGLLKLRVVDQPFLVQFGLLESDLLVQHLLMQDFESADDRSEMESTANGADNKEKMRKVDLGKTVKAADPAVLK